MPRVARGCAWRVFAFGLILCLSAASLYAAPPCTLTSADTWANAGAGLWNTGGNWSGGVPNSTSTNVCITNGTGTATLDISPNVASLQLATGNTLNIANNTSLTVNGSQIINDGSINLNSGGNTTDLIINGGTTTLSGAGTLTMSNNSANRITSTNSSTLVNQSTIQGAGQIGVAAMGLNNSGTINANQSTALDVVGTVTNTGTLEATSGGKLVLQGTFTNTSGIISATGASSTVTLNGAAITDGTLTTATGGLIQESGATSTLGGTIALTGNLTVANNNVLDLSGGLTLTNTGGVLNLSSGGNNTDLSLVGAGTVTLSGTGSVTMSNSASNRIYAGNAGMTLQNNTTIQGAGSIGTAGFAFTLNNAGTISANQSAGLTIASLASVVNSGGIVEATGAGDVLNLNTSINNASGTIRAVNSGVVNLSGASITDGTLTTATGGLIRQNGLTSTLSGTIALTGNLTVANNNVLDLSGGLTLTNTGGVLNLSSSGNNTDLNLVGAGTVTLNGTSSVTMSNSVNRIYAGNAGMTLQNNTTIQGAGGIGTAGFGFTLNNAGTIIANQTAGLTIGNLATTVSNTGLLTATGSGDTLTLGTAITNTGATISATNSGTVTLSGATITGGTLSTSSGGVIHQFGTNSTLAGTIALNGTLNVDNNQLLNLDTGGATMTLNIGAGGSLNLNSGGNNTDVQMLGANGTVNLNGPGGISMTNSGSNRIYAGSSGMTVNNNTTIQGTGNVFQVGIPATLNNTATGIINSNLGSRIELGSSTINNVGLLEATNASDLRLNPGAINNVGGAISAIGASSTVTLNGTTITGGTLSTSGGGVFHQFGANSTLTGTIALNGTLNVDNNQLLNLDTGGASMTLNIGTGGSLNLNSGGNNTDLQMLGASGTVNLNGPGGISLSNSGANRIYAGASGMTVNNNTTIQGTGNVFQLGVPVTLNNTATGIINSNLGGRIELGSSTINNVGLLEATNASDLRLNPGSINNVGGTISAIGAGSTVTLNGTTLTGGTLSTTSNTVGVIQQLGTSSNLAGAITLNGHLDVANNNLLNLNAGLTLTNNGNFSVSSGGNNTDVVLNGAGTVTLAGTGTLTMSNSGANRIYANTGGTTLVNGANHTIQGSGGIFAVGAGTPTLTNSGTILANQSTALILGGAGSDILTNTGTLQANTGSTLHVFSGLNPSTYNAGTLSTGTYYGNGGTIQINALGTTGGEIDTNNANIHMSGSTAAFVDQSGNNALTKVRINTGTFTLDGGYNLNDASIGGFNNQPVTGQVGLVNIGSGSTLTVSGPYAQTGDSICSSAPGVACTTIVNGSLTVGTLSISKGTLMGSGTVSATAFSMNAGGVLLPGTSLTSPGTLTFKGNLAMPGTLDEVINGAGAGQFGVTAVMPATGAPSTGTLDNTGGMVNIIGSTGVQNGSTPIGVGQTLTFMTSNGLTGGFTNGSLIGNTTFNGGLERWTVSSVGNNEVLLATAVNAINATWTTASGNWTTNSGSPNFITNWSCDVAVVTGCMPNNGAAANYNAILNSAGNTMTLDGTSSPSNITVNSLSVQNGTLVVNGSSASLTVAGNVTNAASGRIGTDSSSTLTINGNLVNNGLVETNFFNTGGVSNLNDVLTVTGTLTNNGNSGGALGLYLGFNPSNNTANIGTLVNNGFIRTSPGSTMNLTNQAGGITSIASGSVFEVGGTVNDTLTAGSNNGFANLNAVNGKLVFFNGTTQNVTPTSGTLTVASTGSLGLDDSSTLHVAGNVVNNGLIETNFFNSGGAGNLNDVLTVTGTLTNNGNSGGALGLYLGFNPTNNTANIGTLVNNGFIRTSPGSTLNLTNQAGGITSIASGSVFEVGGTVNDTLTAGSNNGFANLNTVNGKLVFFNGTTQNVTPTGGTLTVASTGALGLDDSSTLHVAGNVVNNGLIETNFFNSGGVANLNDVLTVTGTLTNNGNAGGALGLYLGFNPTNNTANIGTLVNNGFIRTSPGSTMNLTNQAGGITSIASGSVFEVGGTVNDTLTAGSNDGFANLNAVNGKLVFFNGTTQNVTPTGGTLTVASTGALGLDDSSTLHVAGNIVNNGLISTNFFNTGGAGNLNDVLTVTGTLTNNGNSGGALGLYLGFNPTNNVANIDTLVNNGFMRISQGSTLNLTGAGTSTNAGPMTLVGGTLSVAANLSNTGTVQTTGLSPSLINVAGTLTNAIGGNLSLNVSGDKAAISTLANGGTVTVASGALLGVGSGVFSATNGYQQLANGTLNELIGGNTAGQFGVINLGAAGVTLASGAALDITLQNGFTPTNGMSFTFMNYGSETGTFTIANSLFNGNTQQWVLNVTGTSATLTAQAANTNQVTATWSTGDNNWTTSGAFSCTPGPTPCLPNNGGGSTYAVILNSPNTGNFVHSLTLDGNSSSPSSITVDSVALQSGTLNIVSGATLTVNGGMQISNISTLFMISGNLSMGGLLDNQGVIQGSGAISGAGTFTNSGAVYADFGTLDLSQINITNFSGGTLTGGVWQAGVNTPAILMLPGDITSNAGNLFLNGSGSAIVDGLGNDALSTLASNTGGLTLFDGVSLTITPGGGTFANNGGSLNSSFGGSALTISGNLTNSNSSLVNVNGSGGGASIGITGNLSNDSTSTVQVQNGGILSAASVNNSGQFLTGVGSPTDTGGNQVNVTGTFINNSGGVFNLMASGDTATLGALSNAGSINVGAGTTLNDSLNNSGGITISGTQNVTGSFANTNPGVITIQSGGLLTYTVSSSVTATNTGTININSGGTLSLADGNLGKTITLSGAGGTISMFGGTLTSPTTDITLTNFNNGILGKGTISNVRIINQTGGTITPGGGTLTLTPNAGGFTNDGLVSITSGNTLAVNGSGGSGSTTIGAFQTGGLMTVNGGIFTDQDFVTVGFSNGITGTANVTSGGQASDTSLTLGHLAGSIGNVTIDGTNSKWTNSSFVTIGESGTGHLTVQNGGEIDSVGGTIAANGGSSGTALVTGTNSKWANTGALNIGGGGSLTAQSGGLVTTDSASNAGSVIVGSGGTLTDAGGYSQTAGSTTVGGTLSADSYTQTLGTTTVHSGGQLKITNAFTQNGGATNIQVGGSTLAATFMVNGGNAQVDGGLTASALTGVTIGSSGALFGKGTITGNLTNNGTIFPGDLPSSPGTLTVTGDFTQTSTGIFMEDIGSLTTFGKLLDLGSVNLDGTLNIALLNGYTPNLGDTFFFIDPTAVNGVFATVNGSTINGNLFFALIYNPTNVELCVEATGSTTCSVGPPPPVPEPNSIILLASAVALVGWRMRRRSRKSPDSAPVL